MQKGGPCRRWFLLPSPYGVRTAQREPTQLGANAKPSPLVDGFLGRFSCARELVGVAALSGTGSADQPAPQEVRKDAVPLRLLQSE
jgi:hypothetical protein